MKRFMKNSSGSIHRPFHVAETVDHYQEADPGDDVDHEHTQRVHRNPCPQRTPPAASRNDGSHST